MANRSTLRLISSSFILAFSLVFSQAALSHAEHDRARFVAPQGNDSGDCANRFRPCKTISYAIEQAKKGDAVLVAAGDYGLNNPQGLVDILATTVEVKAGYSVVDQYRQASPAQNITTIKGVPHAYAGELEQKGFVVIRDAKFADNPTLSARMAQKNIMQNGVSAATCDNGQANGFACEKVDLVSHVPLSEFSTNPSSANDIWGHVDLNTGTEYAIIGLRNGTGVVSLADPQNPTVVGVISGQSTTWRDIKVYQYYSEQDARWYAYAYVTADSTSEGLVTIDLNNLPNSIALANRNQDFQNAHNVYISDVDYSLNTALPGRQPQLHISGANRFSGAHYSFALTIPAAPSVGFTQTGTNSSDYSHDLSSVTITDTRSATCPNNNNGCTVLLDFNEGNINLWDATLATDHQKLSSSTYGQAEYVHSGWWSDDQQYVLVHDELDEQRRGLNTTVRIFDITDLSDPELAGTWTGPTAAIDHNGFVRGNKYFMSTYERGLTVLDISDPANPVEAGFFDTFPNRDGAGFNGAWGAYPFLPSGLILISDINSGLYVLRDNTLDDQSQISFSEAQTNANEGESVSILVQRSGDSSQAAQVHYEFLPGATTSADLQAQSGTLSWAAGDNSPRTIEVNIFEDNLAEEPEKAFIRLHNASGTQINNASLHTLVIGGTGVGSAASLVQTDITLYEGQPGQEVRVQRVRGDDEIRVSYALQSGSGTVGEDMPDINGELFWAAGDNEDKTITLTTLNDSSNETDEVITLVLTGAEPNMVIAPDTMTITIKDDDSNQAPIADAGSNTTEFVATTVRLNGQASDPENDTLTYMWEQTAGDSVSLSDSTILTPTFRTPGSVQTLTFRLTVTDPFGVQNSDEVSINLRTQPDNTPSSDSGGGGTLASLLLLTLITLRLKRLK